ncbi:MAG: hypothetical protein KDK70_39120, partial [Myxococcales bacterium]|nr:hypothetical protein [Myxococcales bacterium]
MTFPGGPAAAAGLAQAAASGQTTAFAAAAASAQAAASGLAAPAEADARAPAAVLGLDAEEVTVGARLTRALRTAFAARGLGGGQEAGLPELRLALGCAS